MCIYPTNLFLFLNDSEAEFVSYSHLQPCRITTDCKKNPKNPTMARWVERPQKEGTRLHTILKD